MARRLLITATRICCKKYLTAKIRCKYTALFNLCESVWKSSVKQNIVDAGGLDPKKLASVACNTRYQTLDFTVTVFSVTMLLNDNDVSILTKNVFKMLKNFYYFNLISNSGSDSYSIFF